MSRDPLTFTEVFESMLGEEALRESVNHVHEKTVRRFSREELTAAMQSGQFEVYYQPKVDATTHKMAGAEALLRWNHPDLGLLAPDVFLPSAETTGFIHELGAWVIRQVASFNKRLRALKKNFVGRLSINVSPSQFNDSTYLAAMLRATERFSFPNQFLEIELTEKGVLNDIEKASRLMSSIREYGISIAIDDFGTGFSSMASLATLPISTVKLDISFVSRIQESELDRKIVRSVLLLCKELNVVSVAEGVEDHIQADLLREWGCDLFQGFLFYAPIKEEFFLQLIE